MAPFKRRLSQRVTTVAATADQEFNVAEAPVTGVFDVYFTPDTVLTGADTDSRTLAAYNRASGAGTTKSHEKAFTNGVNAAVQAKTAITVVSDAVSNVCTKGDLIALKSTHVGSSGLAMPPGLVTVEFTAT